jgi:hypothetical protein
MHKAMPKLKNIIVMKSWLMDGIEGFRSIYYQLHKVGRCLHLNAKTKQSQRNKISGLKTYLQ